MKQCTGCLDFKPVDEFPVRNDRSGRLRPYCKICSNSISRKRYEAYKRRSPFKMKCSRAKSRATNLKVPFDLTPEYLEKIWDGVCPVTGVEIKFETDRRDELAAELDRFIPEKGYVKGNVAFLSRRANRLKNDVTSVELKQLLKWMEDNEG